MSDALLWILLTQLPILREILKKGTIWSIRCAWFSSECNKTWSLRSSGWHWVIVGFVASDASACWLWCAAGRRSNQTFFSSSFSIAMNRVHREWRCSVDFATGLQSPEGRRWDCNLAARLWRNSLTFVVIGYTDPSVVMRSGANVRSRFKKFIDSRRWIGFIRKSSLVDFAKAMTLFYRGVMLLLLTSL